MTITHDEARRLANDLYRAARPGPTQAKRERDNLVGYVNAMEAATAWRPIETAPRGLILVCGGVGAYEPVAIAHWSSDADRRGNPGWVSENWPYPCTDPADMPTHWLPLPSTEVTR